MSIALQSYGFVYHANSFIIATLFGNPNEYADESGIITIMIVQT